MNYQIKITKLEPNPNFKEEMIEYRKPRYHYDPQIPEPRANTIEDVLTCELTEEQFKKVKLESLKVFE